MWHPRDHITLPFTSLLRPLGASGDGGSPAWEAGVMGVPLGARGDGVPLGARGDGGSPGSRG